MAKLSKALVLGTSLFGGVGSNPTAARTVFSSYCIEKHVFCTMKNYLMTSVAEWSKALVLGTSLFGGVGSNPTAARLKLFQFIQ